MTSRIRDLTRTYDWYIYHAYSRPALTLRRRPINAPKRSGSGAVQYKYFHYTALHTDETILAHIAP